MTRVTCAALALLSASVAARPAQAEPAEDLTPRDFAFGRELQLTDASSPLWLVDIPADMYRHSRSEGLLDVWVFNASGAQVPHALVRAASSPPPEPAVQPVPFFPIALSHAREALDVSITIARAPSGRVLSLQSATPDAPQPTGSTAAYVLDLRVFEQRPTIAARFTWQQAPDNLLLPLSVESSEDLVHWSPLSATGGLLHLEHAGQRIERDRVEWGSLRAPFVRVRPVGRDSFPVPLDAVFVEPAPSDPPPQLERVAVTPASAQEGVYRFDLGGEIPVEELQLELPEDNSVIAGELWVAEREAGPFRQLAAARFYRISAHGQPLDGPRLRVERQRARYYELRVDRTHVGLGSGQPTLATYHVPEQLLFLRRGQAPFRVAYGRYAVKRQRFEANELLLLLPAKGAGAQPEHATMLAPQPLGGEQLLQPPKPPPPYKTYALWAILIAGVGLLMGLAARLARGES